METDQGTPEANFAANMRAIREARGTSQEALAEAMTHRGFSWRQSTVHAVEKGDRRIQLNEAAAIADMFDQSVRLMMERQGSVMDYFAEQSKDLGRRLWRLEAAAKAFATYYEKLVIELGDEVANEPGFAEKVNVVGSTWLGVDITEHTHRALRKALREWAVARSSGFSGDSARIASDLLADDGAAASFLDQLEQARKKAWKAFGGSNGEHQ